jgi:hypothetical protein
MQERKSPLPSVFSDPLDRLRLVFLCIPVSGLLIVPVVLGPKTVARPVDVLGS